ncbi:murein hydrolase activator EnvC family protein [Aliidiomarina celeris]|uniref:murein hydrolase activator EnvC family protein n=1 Tax=Aliidiomarina celeris TaxID=2249428 RepID=UPI000DE9F6B5|nr:peptidoglycan DD-metalloendopeptidase family protein [Aliidiomarina celeris]
MPSFGIQTDSGAERQRTEQQLKDLQSEIEQRRRQMERRQQQLTRSERALRDLEQQINQTSRSLRRIESNIAEVQQRIRALETEQENLTASLHAQAELLSDQIEAAYRAGNYSFLQLLLNQDHPGRFERLLEYYRHLNEARVAQLQALRETEQQLALVGANLTNEQQALAQRRSQQQQEQQTLEQQQQQQEQRVLALQQAQGSEAEALQNLLQNEQQLTELLAALSNVLDSVNIELAGLGALRGRLEWPLQGPVVHRYGSSRSSQVDWRGIVIQAQEEAPIQAIADGRVLFADWLRGYGLVIVLDHGEGFMSLYGYNQAIMYEVGDPVQKGQVISLAGKSGGQREPSLYFEIRQNGDPVNPLTYLKR